jgi:hypothetical protein
MCSEESERRVFCLDHIDVRIDGDWAEVFRSTDAHEAEVARSILHDAKMSVETQNLPSSDHAWSGADPQSRCSVHNPAKLFVPIDKYLKAKDILDDWRNSTADNTLSQRKH